jgi:arylsulfatase A-like enzyme
MLQMHSFTTNLCTALFLVVTCVLAPLCHAEESARRPNIVLILADDLGYGDIGVYGCKDVPTPHFDSLAENGVRFTNGYANHPVCSPSRAGLLSGMYQHRFGFEHNSGPPSYTAPNFGLPRSVPTLAEKLDAAGYATAMVGKWHIGFNEDLRPHARGFDYFYGFLNGARSFFPDPKGQGPLYRNDQQIEEESDYLTDVFARESVAFIEKHKDEPFFLYLAFNAVHVPLEASKKYVDRFPDIADPNRKILAGMLSAMDDATGQVMDTLRRLDLEENTLVLFYSDNGGAPQKNFSLNTPLRGQKGQMFEGGIRVPFIIQWKGKIEAGSTYDQPVMGFDVHATALAAAGVKNTSDNPIDGKDLLPYLNGEAKGQPHDQLFWRAGTQHAARIGDWKLVKQRRQPSMLFNLKDDIAEQHNLAAKMPDKLKELQAAYESWSDQMMDPQWIRQDRRNARPGGQLK